MDVTLTKIREMVDVDTVVGTPIETADAITIIPVSKVSYGFGSGGGDLPAKEKAGFGGGVGAGVKVDPIGFLVVKDGGVRMINVSTPAEGTVDRVIERLPEIIDMLQTVVQKFTGDKSSE